MLVKCKLIVACGRSCVDVKTLAMSEAGQVFHSNHYLVPHPGVVDTVWLEDSRFRVERVEELCRGLGDSPSMESLQELFTELSVRHMPSTGRRCSVGDAFQHCHGPEREGGECDTR